jgi:hypothetical protein
MESGSLASVCLQYGLAATHFAAIRVIVMIYIINLTLMTYQGLIPTHTLNSYDGSIGISNPNQNSKTDYLTIVQKKGRMKLCII